ncbi:MAG: toprim domain-containing protein [Nautiliaceae bacterium]
MAVENASGAYHVRNPYGKYVVFTAFNQENTFSLIKKRKRNKKVIVVEGSFDALSVEQIKDFEGLDIIILNSVNVKKLLESKVLKNYKTVILALDNDEAGKKVEEILFEKMDKYVSSIEKLKYNEKDINKALIKENNVSFNKEFLLNANDLLPEIEKVKK